MSAYLMTPTSIPRKRARQSGALATFEPLLATPELVMSASNASFESLEPSTPTSQRTFSANVLPPPTPRFTRTQTPMSKTVVPPSPSPITRVRSTIPRTTSSYPTVPVTPLKTSRVPASAPPATPIHQQRVGPPRTPHTPSPVTAACPVPGVFLDPFYDGPSSSMSWSPSSKELPFRATPFARASVQRASNALQDHLFDSADPFMDRASLEAAIEFESPDNDMDVDDAFGPAIFSAVRNSVTSTPVKNKPAASLLPTPEPEAPFTPPRQVRRGIPRSPRHWNLAAVSAVKA